MKNACIAVFACLLVTLSNASANGGDAMSFIIKSSDFGDGEPIAKTFSCDGDDLSPGLEWRGAPTGTRGYALIVEDPDAPGGVFVHWVAYDLPLTMTGLERGAGNPRGKAAFKQGLNDFGKTGYGGPCPPKGHGRHRYHFVLRALDVESLGLASGASRAEAETAMKGRVLGETRTTGVYQR
jgi:Raf kinase inhibitor-like YbhB/YbcL family protein